MTHKDKTRPERDVSPQLCAQLLSHPSMNSPLVAFLLYSSFYCQKNKKHFEAVRVRSGGATLNSVGVNFGVGTSRASQIVFHGILQLRRLIEFDTKFRSYGDLVGSIANDSKFIADGFHVWLSRRGVTTWEQLAGLPIEIGATLPSKKLVQLGDFLAGLSAAALQADLSVGPVMHHLTTRFACHSCD